MTVVLNIYDLNEMNETLFNLGLGMYHSGVEIGGSEYTFSSGSGVFSHPPRAAGGARFREAVDMGMLPSAGALSTAIEELRHEFKGSDYNVLEKNCNHFAQALIWRLLNRQLPGYVNRMAGIGSMFSCLMPQHMLKDAPVDGAPSSSSSSGASGPRSSQMDRDRSSGGGSSLPFGGSGFKLGSNSATDESNQTLLSSNDTSGNSTSNGVGAASDSGRREMMRAAALKRLEGK